MKKMLWACWEAFFKFFHLIKTEINPTIADADSPLLPILKIYLLGYFRLQRRPTHEEEEEEEAAFLAFGQRRKRAKNSPKSFVPKTESIRRHRRRC